MPDLPYRITNSGMESTDAFPIELRADQEHSGIRTTIVVALFVFLVLFYILLSSLWSVFAPGDLADYTFVVSCSTAVGLSLVSLWALEKYLKQVWPSGRAVLLDEKGVRTQDPEMDAAQILWQDEPFQISWWFYLRGYPRGGRERRLPKNWVCVATQLQAGENFIVVYTYAPAKEAVIWTHYSQEFRQINPAEIYKSGLSSRFVAPSRPEIPPKLLLSQDGKHWQAEQRRWLYGFEVEREDFKRLMDFISARQTYHSK